MLRIYDHLSQRTAIAFIDEVLQKLPFNVERIQTDNGSEFQAAFHWHVLDRGIERHHVQTAAQRCSAAGAPPCRPAGPSRTGSTG